MSPVIDHRIIAALHLPDPVVGPWRSQAWLEDYCLANAGVFARAGIPAVKLQDQTREPGPARIETVARMAALGRLIRSEYPDLGLGIIVQAHDAVASLAIAAASGASFVRLKVYVGAALGAEGTREALCVSAREARARLCPEVAILADVHDRTTMPLGGASQPQAARWAEQMGADALVITGSSFADTLARIAAVRQAGVTRPILVGGGVDAGNVREALAHAAGAVVSTSIMLKGSPDDALIRWDEAACRALVEAAGEQ